MYVVMIEVYIHPTSQLFGANTSFCVAGRMNDIIFWAIIEKQAFFHWRWLV